MNCPVCAAAAEAGKKDLWDDRYGYPGQYTLMRCASCGHQFLDCSMTPDELGALYTHYYPRRNFDLAQYKPHAAAGGFAAWFGGLGSASFRYVPPGVRVLDVGCGFGQSLGYHTARGCDVYGVEADENIRRVADKFGFKVHVGLFDEHLYDAEYFDYVTMDQVIEHVTDPLATLRGVARILRAGGTAILSTPNAGGWGAKLFGRRWINWHVPYHVQFFSRSSMRLAAEQAGLKLVQAKTITNSEWLYYQWLHLATYPETGEASHFWTANNAAIPLRHRRLARVAGWVHKLKINHLITRFFDGLGCGDNYVFILMKK